MSQIEPLTSQNPTLHQQTQPVLIAHGPTDRPEIALTFDDGPSPEYTPPLLAILRQSHIPATFFMLGRAAQRSPDLVRAVVDAGHAIGNHSWDHPYLTRLSADQIFRQLSATREVIEQVTGICPSLFRPPYGYYNRRTLAAAQALGHSAILWNVDPVDWSCPGSAAIITRVLSRLTNGAIILLHDGVSDEEASRAQTLEALPQIIEAGQARGFRFVSLPHMLAQRPYSSLDRFLQARLPPRVFRRWSGVR
ncbi:MAG TPA: polysaccharide deacetylase family protein [Ktedonobacterales bacterium]